MRLSPRMDFANVRRDLPPRELLQRIRTKMLGTVDGYVCWTVDGELVRNFVDLDFVSGGNPGRYRYVPLGELWVEHGYRPTDAAPTLLHELVESRLMQEAGLGYGPAHDQALAAEEPMRALIVAGRLRVPALGDVCQVVARYLAGSSV